MGRGGAEPRGLAHCAQVRLLGCRGAGGCGLDGGEWGPGCDVTGGGVRRVMLGDTIKVGL